MLYRESALPTSAMTAWQASSSAQTSTQDAPYITNLSSTTALLALLNQLVQHYPAQAPFLASLRRLPPSFLPEDSLARIWTMKLAHSLRTSNFVQYTKLARPEVYNTFVPNNKGPDDERGYLRASLPAIACDTLLLRLSNLVRQQTWQTLRAAYKEFSCHEASNTNAWLRRNLGLEAHKWLSERAREGDVQRKEGSDERWSIVKPR